MEGRNVSFCGFSNIGPCPGNVRLWPEAVVYCSRILASAKSREPTQLGHLAGPYITVV